VRHRILIVDDVELYLESTKRLLQENGYRVDGVTNGDAALDLIRNAKFAYSLVILDYKLEGENGATLTSKIAAINPDLYVVIYSADPSREALKNSWRAGAADFLDKTVSQTELLATVRNWCQKHEHTHLTISLPNCLDSEYSRNISKLGMVGRSASMAKVAEEVLRYRNKRQNVLILGESGVGKELVARSLHAGSAHLFRAVNCATYNGDAILMESELFGAEKGAYTGADASRKGIFEAANGGTVFLDEIHTLSVKAQEKLLRVLESRTVRPVGSTREYPVNFRLVAAGKADLEERIGQGRFLGDLFYRLDTLRIEIPALRERREDVAPLVAHFCDVYSKRENEKKAFLARTVAYMEKYPWPGNVRELENTVIKLCARSPREKIAPEDLDVAFFQDASPTLVPGAGNNLQVQVDEIRREVIENALKASNGAIRPAAKKLNMARSTLYDHMKRLGIQLPKPKQSISQGREGGFRP
jgi:DNA-binding NtrC family response regulator